MRAPDGNWTLRELIDLESLMDRPEEIPALAREAALMAAGGKQGVQARRAGYAAILARAGGGGTGARVMAAVAWVAAGAAVIAFATGAAAVWGLLDAQRGGVHAPLFILLLVGMQWLILLVALLVWLFRGRMTSGSLWVRPLVAWLVAKFSGQRDRAWWSRLWADGGKGRDALMWRMARVIQIAGMAFNLGLLTGLMMLVLVRHIGFFWESTTELAMRDILIDATRWISAPWSAWWPGALPDAAVIDASRWVPGARLSPGPAQWWRFLLMAVLVWGFLPRFLLWLLCVKMERSALAALDFQARHLRAYWRQLVGATRADTHESPLDGVLVLDVGGCGWSPAPLRPFLLSQLRVNPTAWHSVAVLDGARETEAAAALAAAPAGIVCLVEGWALSPARMRALHASIRHGAGPAAPIIFLVADTGPDGDPVAAHADARRAWEAFTDSLADPEVSVSFFG